MSELFQTIIDWYMLHMSYGTVMLLMAIESTFLPMPSEFVIPPAAWKAAEGDMNIFLIILFGTVGALIGSLINYTLSYFLGRRIVLLLPIRGLLIFVWLPRKKFKKPKNTL
jgi:membrane protein DedA with SNARE-associated domain